MKKGLTKILCGFIFAAAIPFLTNLVLSGNTLLTQSSFSLGGALCQLFLLISGCLVLIGMFDIFEERRYKK